MGSQGMQQYGTIKSSQLELKKGTSLNQRKGNVHPDQTKTAELHLKDYRRESVVKSNIPASAKNRGSNTGLHTQVNISQLINATGHAFQNDEKQSV